VREGFFRSALSSVFDGVAGNRLAEEVFAGATGARLRILAYHGVDDPDVFSAHMAHIRAHYNPVSVDQVLDSLDGASLPRRAVWVTFDDGHPSVVDLGLPIIEKWEVPVTLFVCPAVIDTTAPLWWQAVEQALAAGKRVTWNANAYSGLAGGGLLVRRLKLAPDAERRRVVAAIMSDDRLGKSLTQPQLTTSAIRRLARVRATIGNHTWDHPCLDTCEPDEQRRQIQLAHRSLGSMNPLTRPVLAYPNGNWTRMAEETAVELGYRIGLLFNHQLTNRSHPPMSWSRLRVNSDTSLSRFQSILSGIHPGLRHSRHK
jgi:peptidoglycan/xylan/chitin deacetylase (PgdA/CDA1 family)